MEKIPEPCLEPPEHELPRCPYCGAETDTFYRGQHGWIVGCDECVDMVDAWNYVED